MAKPLIETTNQTPWYQKYITRMTKSKSQHKRKINSLSSLNISYKNNSQVPNG